MKNTAMEERSHHFRLAIITDCWVRQLHMVYLRNRIIMIWNINSLADSAVLWNHGIRTWPLPSGMAAAGCALGQSREHRLLRLTLNPMWLIMQNFTHSSLLLSVGLSRYGLSPYWLLWGDTVQMSLTCMPRRSKKVIDEARRQWLV